VTLQPATFRREGQPGTLGVLGGGQLGRMFVHAAQTLGFRTVVLDPDPHSPAGQVAHQHLQAAYTDEAALAEMARTCDAVTTEFENVPAQALRWLAARRPVAPAADAVATCQHRALEKAHFSACGVPCVPHARLESPQDLAALHGRAGEGLFPSILKTATLGYDGKGQVRVERQADLASAWAALREVPCLLEKRVALAAELSVVVARDAAGCVVHLPVQQNLHRDGILAVTVVPAPDVSHDVAAQAVQRARAVAESLGYVGVLCVEFFLLEDGTLLANEMAPRPHNSGHHSIDACDVSQFDLQVRAMAGLPLVMPRQHSPAVMLNLLGDLWFQGQQGDLRGVAGDGFVTAPRTVAGVAGSAPGSAADSVADSVALEPPWARVLALPGVHLHLYGKTEPRRGRKMGHLTVTAADAATALEVAGEVARRLGLPSLGPAFAPRGSSGAAAGLAGASAG
jgi:5-(carboxyamino)imidazole ribonucleotide synthase